MKSTHAGPNCVFSFLRFGIRVIELLVTPGATLYLKSQRDFPFKTC